LTGKSCKEGRVIKRATGILEQAKRTLLITLVKMGEGRTQDSPLFKGEGYAIADHIAREEEEQNASHSDERTLQPSLNPNRHRCISRGLQWLRMDRAPLNEMVA